MNYVNICNHTESYLTASTLNNMMQKVKKNGSGYFCVAENGTLISALKTYYTAPSVGLKPILGIDLYFKDELCPIINGTPSEQAKYFKLLMFFKDQPSYQEMVRMVSDKKRKKVKIGEDFEFPLFNWKDLEHLSKFNVLVSSSNIEDMVSKHLLFNRPDLSKKYYNKLISLFGERYTPAICPFEHTHYQERLIRFTLFGNKKIKLPLNTRVDTDSKGYKNKAIDVYKFSKRHKKLLRVYYNGLKSNIKLANQDIMKVEMVKDFIQINEGDIQALANKQFLELHGTNLLINDYSYYADQDDKIVQNMKLGEDGKFLHQNLHIRTPAETAIYLKNTLGLEPSQIKSIFENTNKWASQFDDFKLKYDIKLVDYGSEPEKLLMKSIHEKGRMKWDNPRYVKQLREEMDLLVNNGVVNLAPYFLPLIEISEYYKQKGHLVGIGRGSAPGFLVSYLTGITQIDPIKNGLSTSRFLTLDRVQQGNLPDIDFDASNRDILEGEGGFFHTHYGRKYAKISTRGLLRLKSAILDANRFVHGEVQPEIQKLSKSLPNTPQGVNDYDYIFGYENGDDHVSGIFETNEDLQKYAKERPDEWDIVKKAVSLVRQNSVHACARVLSSIDIDEVIPVHNGITDFEAKECEKAGFIKYDFLVVKALLDIEGTLKKINEKNKESDLEVGYFTHEGKKTYIWDLPQDPEVFNMLSLGETETVFQLNTPTATPFLQALRPKKLEDLTATVALRRPGPMDFIDENTGRDMSMEYVERSFGRSNGDIEILNKLLPDTYGVIVYQEDISRIAKEIGDMSVEDAENVRIAMGKKKIKLMESLKPKFLEGANKKVGEQTASRIWDMMATFARYGFNKCISGDTVLYRNKNSHKPITVAEMYKTKNDKNWAKENNKINLHKKYKRYGYGMSFSKHENTIHLNKIKDIRFEGVRPTYKLTTESGRFIKTTLNHKFPTPEGQLMLKDMKVGGEIYVNTGYKQEKWGFRFGGHLENLPKAGQRGFQKKEHAPSSLFDERSLILKEKHNNCQMCNCDMSQKRKEIHHIDGDHGNQDWENLIMVCASCHKKEHYKMGRTKYGEKGLVCSTEKIASIEYVGEEEVYDVEMEAPYHNFSVDNGIITSNSHALSYASTGFACAFLKYHYPLEWWAAVLTNAETKEINEVFYKYTKDIMLPPDINLSREDITIDYEKQKLRQKLSAITGLGGKVAEKIVAARPFKDLKDFVIKKPCGPAMIRRLIYIGALDSLMPSDANTMLKKMWAYEEMVKQIEFEAKVEELKNTPNSEEKLSKLLVKGRNKAKIDPYYMVIDPLKDYLIKKEICPTMNMDLYELIKKYAKNAKIFPRGSMPMVMDNRGFEVYLASADILEKMDSTITDRNVYFCVPAYVMKAETFTYAKNTKKAFKMVLDSSGYISEKVIWPDYDSGELIYPKSLKKGCLAFFFYQKRADREGVNIYHTIVEVEGVDEE